MKNFVLTTKFCTALALLALATAATSAQTSNPLDIRNAFIASGYMGCGFKFLKSVPDASRKDSTASQVTYVPCNPAWGGLFWQQPANDWQCEKKGKDLSGKGYTKITFWAKGASGNEEIKYRAGMDCDEGYQTEEEVVTLSKEWKQYSVNLKGKNMANIHGAFCFAVAADANPDGKGRVVFYFDDLQFE